MGQRQKIAVILCLCILTGCAYSPGLVDRAIAYNEAIATSTNEMLLLNSLRARDRLPTFFTRSTSNTATTTISPTMSVAVPFGLHVPLTKVPNTLTLQLGESSQSQLTLQNLDDQKFMRGILTPLSSDELGFYLRQGWPPEILFTMAISKIRITQPAIDSLAAAFDAGCKSDPTKRNYCNGNLPEEISQAGPAQYINDEVKHCESDGALLVSGSTGREPATYIFENYPTNPVNFHCFQTLMRLVIGLDPVPKPVETLEVVYRGLPRASTLTAEAIVNFEKSDLVAGVHSNDTYDVCRRSKTTAIALSGLHATTENPAPLPANALTRDPAVTTLVDGGPAPLKLDCAAVAAANGGNAPDARSRIELTTRSFDEMVYYLGEVLRAKQGPAGGSDTQVWSWDWSSKRYAAWSLYEASSDVSGPIGVSVDFQGKTFSIPVACNDSRDCVTPEQKNRSLQVLDLLNQIWGLQKEESDVPVVPTVTVVNQ